MKSPIEQQLIDGEMYWDNIASDWLRLIDRSSSNVIGHYKPDTYLGGFAGVRNSNFPESTRPMESKRFDTWQDARLWIETEAYQRYAKAREAHLRATNR